MGAAGGTKQDLLNALEVRPEPDGLSFWGRRFGKAASKALPVRRVQVKPRPGRLLQSIKLVLQFELLPKLLRLALVKLVNFGGFFQNISTLSSSTLAVAFVLETGTKFSLIELVECVFRTR